MTGRAYKPHKDSGSVAPLGIGLALVSLATILVFTSASSMFLMQRRLTSLAEFAALSRVLYGLPVETFLRETGANGLRGVRIAIDDLSDSLTHEVTLCSNWRSPGPTVLQLVETEICGHGSARAG